jgi:hypothetical protein
MQKKELTVGAEYRSIWAELGLDLAAHDALLGVLGQADPDIYLAHRKIVSVHRVPHLLLEALVEQLG